ncbi:MAG: folate family ECF transporter S component [Oscillospiraceae bacterium]|jgi:ECF transporter S component (folate family)|nr:folate family ECF transporter S component [Oscillospiraceae bacterium]
MRGSIARKVALGALFVALDIIFARFFFVYLPPGSTLVRLSPQFLAYALAGKVLGPWFAALTALAGDLLGMLVNPAGLSFLPGISVVAALEGLQYGLWLRWRPISLWRCAVAVACDVFVLSLGVKTFFVLLYFTDSAVTLSAYAAAARAALPWRLLQAALYAPSLALVLRALQRARVFTGKWR